VVTIRAPHAPRPSSVLCSPESALDDEVTWDGVEASGSDVVRVGARDCQITASRLSGVRFTGSEHHRLRLIDVVLDDCEFSGAVLSEATFVRVAFNRCRMSGLVASGLNGQDVRWFGCKLDGANFRAAKLERCEWSDCVMNEADFYGSKLTAVSLYHCDLTGAQFSKARCAAVNLHGSTLRAIGGADSLGGCCIGSEQVASLALPVLAAVGITVDDDPDGPVSPPRT
jgi:uncharacterized protein YjbI with pentapeptide repeats